MSAGEKRKHEIKEAPGSYGYCQHESIVFSVKERTVTCGLCNKTLDPFDALQILGRKTWWEMHRVENEIEFAEKRVRKVQCAAITALYDFGIDPEEYERRWNKERDKRAASAPKDEPSWPTPVPEENWQW